MSPQTIIFIGRSGCGKGTQAKLIDAYLRRQDAQKHPIYHIETGVGFRDFIQGKSHTNRLSKEIYDRQDRQPDYLAIWMWSHFLIEKLTGEEHLIIDGTPRSLPEAAILNNALEFYKRQANVVYLNVSRALSERRLVERGRGDDSDMAKITKRLDWFEHDVAPAIEYFRSHSLHNFIEVDGEQSVERVQADIIAALKIY